MWELAPTSTVESFPSPLKPDTRPPSRVLGHAGSFPACGRPAASSSSSMGLVEMTCVWPKVLKQ